MQITTTKIRWAIASVAGLGGSAMWANAADFGDHMPAAALIAGATGTALGWRRVHALVPDAGRRPGMASRREVWVTSSARAMRRKAKVVRPSLGGLSRLELLRADPNGYSTPLCRIGRQWVRTSIEESTLSIGIPGTGKTAALACRVIDSPGAVIATSTATDLHDLTVRIRARAGTIHVFNPGGIGGLASTLRWSPLTGCQEPATAHRRAKDLMGPPGEGEGARWHGHGRTLLAVLLHAAALTGGARMRDVQAWLGEPDRALPLVERFLEASPERAAMTQAARSALGTNPRTRDGILLAVTPALAWLTSPEAAACGDPDTLERLFDLEQFVDNAGTLYLLGDDDGTLGPLVGALTAEIAHQARDIASKRPGGRLDPALRMVLDEVALICPVPLDRWLSELRKRSITIDAAVQALAQLRDRWGANGCSAILNAASAVMLYGGTKDATDLKAFCDLAGDRAEESVTRDGSGKVSSRSDRNVAVVTPAELFKLPTHHVFLVRRDMTPTFAVAPVVWHRRDVKRAARGTDQGAKAGVRWRATRRHDTPAGRRQEGVTAGANGGDRKASGTADARRHEPVTAGANRTS